MATLLDEILSEAAPKKIILSGNYGASHSPSCNCVYCKSAGYKPAGAHKYWRQRRAERLCAPPQTPAIVSRSIPPPIGTLPPIIKIGELKRAALVKQWKAKLQRTKSEVAKQRYKKYIFVILKKLRPSLHQSEKDMQWLLAKKKNSSTAKNSYPAIDVKNYSIQNQNVFIRWLQKQIERKMLQSAGISPQQQKLILDMRGQTATGHQLRQLAQRIARETGLQQKNINIVTW